MKGSSASIRERMWILAVFAVAFVGGASVTFGGVSLVGAAVRTEFADGWRGGVAGVTLLGLALVDVYAMSRRCYCPFGWSRQTPRTLVHRYGSSVGVAAWGFDAGLAVTTFRVAAITWGALVLTALGFAPWWTGPAYGGGFVAALAISLLTTIDAPGLERQLSRRSVVQAISAAGLLTAGGLVLSRLG